MLQLHQLNERGIMTSKKQPNRYTIDMPIELRTALEQLARQEHVPLSIIVRKALRQYIFLAESSTDATSAAVDHSAETSAENSSR